MDFAVPPGRAASRPDLQLDRLRDEWKLTDTIPDTAIAVTSAINMLAPEFRITYPAVTHRMRTGLLDALQPDPVTGGFVVQSVHAAHLEATARIERWRATDSAANARAAKAAGLEAVTTVACPAPVTPVGVMDEGVRNDLPPPTSTPCSTKVVAPARMTVHGRDDDPRP